MDVLGTPWKVEVERALVHEADIPWSELAFRSVTLCLQSYFADRRHGRFGFHEDSLLPPASY